MDFFFGSASIDITPPVGIALVGYYRSEPSQGILDRLSATVMVFQSETTQLVLISVDHIGLFVEQVQLIRESIAQALEIVPADIIVLFTHTHSGADVDPVHTDDLTRHYFNQLVDKLVLATEAAARDKQPCCVGWGVIDGDIGVNRRVHNADSRAHMGTNPDGLVDKRMGVLKITHTQTEALLGIIVICTAHANVLKGDSLLISADFPGWSRSVLHEALQCPVMIVIGSAGDCNARWRGSTDDLKRMAASLSNHVLALFPTIQTKPLDRLIVRSSSVTLALRDVPPPQQAKILAQTAADAWEVDTQPWLNTINSLYTQGKRQLSIKAELQLVRINEGTLIGIPMEPFMQFALRVSQTTNDQQCFFMGYTNGWIGYLPSATEIPYGGYEIEWMPMIYGLDSGFYMPLQADAEEIVINAALNLYHTTQKLNE